VFTSHLVVGFAHAGSGDVLAVQKLMQVVASENKHKEAAVAKSKDEAAAKATEEAAASLNEVEGSSTSCPPGAAAILGIAAIGCSDDLSKEMTMRMIDHVIQYGNVSLKRAIPLGIALLFVSNAKQQAIDLLSKLSHDADADVAMGAVLGMGLVGAGTNNSKIAALLRALAAYYSAEPNILFVVRISQGLLYLGKGLLTLSPVHSDRGLVQMPALGSLLALLTVAINAENLLFKGTTPLHWLLFLTVPAMSPRMLICVDEEGEPVAVQVRVGQAVDIVGQVGNPKAVTGFQTHSTPVLLGHGDRAELASDQYIALTSILEGVVVVRPNPEWKPQAGEGKGK